jgi:hypothetical protein
MVTVKHESDGESSTAANFSEDCEIVTGLVSGGGNSIVRRGDGVPGRNARGKPV